MYVICSLDSFAAADLHNVEEKTTAVEDKGSVMMSEKLTMAGEQQVTGEGEVTADNTQTTQSTDDAEVISGLNAVNETAKQGNSLTLQM